MGSFQYERMIEKRGELLLQGAWRRARVEAAQQFFENRRVRMESRLKQQALEAVREGNQPVCSRGDPVKLETRIDGWLGYEEKGFPGVFASIRAAQ
jgi:hypothetical protein